MSTEPRLNADTVRFSCPQCDWSHELPNSRYALLESSYTHHVHVRHWPSPIIVWSQDAEHNDGSDGTQ
jgi:hypothetical protein